MKYGRYGWSHALMSWGLGVVFLWIGLNILTHPDSWIGYVPDTNPFGMSREHLLQLNGLFDVALGSLLLLRWWQKLVAILVTLHLGAIIITNGIDPVIIRDVGLLGAALALVAWPTKYRKHRWWKIWQRSSSHSSEE